MTSNRHKSSEMPHWPIVTAVLCRTAVLVCALLASSGSCNDGVWQPNGLLASVRVSRTGMPLLVPVNIGGSQHKFVLDTNSTFTVIDRTLASKLQPERGLARVETIAAGLVMPRYKAPVLKIDQAECTWLTSVYATDLAEVREAIEKNVEGVLGMDVLCRFLVHVDFDNGLLAFCDPAKCERPPGIPIPMRRGAENCPFIEARLANLKHEKFFIDTACMSTGVLDSDRFSSLERIGLLALAGVRKEVLSADGSTMVKELGRIKGLSIGELSYEDLVFTPGKANTLGLLFLCRHRVTFDFYRNQLFLAPARRYGVRDRSDCEGMEIEQGAIHLVARGSVADKAGVRQHDELVAIDGVDVRELTPVTVKGLLSLPRVLETRLKIRRENSTVDIVLPPGQP